MTLTNTSIFFCVNSNLNRMLLKVSKYGNEVITYIAIFFEEIVFVNSTQKLDKCIGYNVESYYSKKMREKNLKLELDVL